MPSLEDELNEAMKTGAADALAQIKLDDGELDEEVGKLVERVVLPILGAHKDAILRLAREVDELRCAHRDEDLGDE